MGCKLKQQVQEVANKLPKPLEIMLTATKQPFRAGSPDLPDQVQQDDLDQTSGNRYIAKRTFLRDYVHLEAGLPEDVVGMQGLTPVEPCLLATLVEDSVVARYGYQGTLGECHRDHVYLDERKLLIEQFPDCSSAGAVWLLRL